MKKMLFFLLAMMSLNACSLQNKQGDDAAPKPQLTEAEKADLSKAYFAGGCFWCTESDFEKFDGVQEAVSGYMGGDVENPSYEQVSAGRTGHREAIQVLYDPAQITYSALLDIFWKHIDPTDSGGQFVDRGTQYTSAIFYTDEEQHRLAEESKKALQDSGKFEKPIVTEIIPATQFYVAEEYHQDYYQKNPLKYNFYRSGSGRDRFLEETWGEELNRIEGANSEADMGEYQKPPDSEIKNMLNDIQYDVTQKDGTEKPFENEYWDEKRDGIYVDIVSGEPLYSSKDKFESGTGWPSFTKPLEPENIVEKTDRKFFMTRTEVRSKHADSHLGHVFKDGPEPTGLRYCMNSAALRFIPKEDLEKEGYGKYMDLFEE